METVETALVQIWMTAIYDVCGGDERGSMFCLFWLGKSGVSRMRSILPS